MSELKAGGLLLRGADPENVGAKALTYSEVRERLRPLGIVISKTGEMCRINYFSEEAKTAFFTKSLADAYERVLAMSRTKR